MTTNNESNQLTLRLEHSIDQSKTILLEDSSKYNNLFLSVQRTLYVDILDYIYTDFIPNNNKKKQFYLHKSNGMPSKDRSMIFADMINSSIEEKHNINFWIDFDDSYEFFILNIKKIK